MELKVIDAKGQVSGSLAASDALFAREYNEALVHQLVTAFLANARSGNRAQLTRADVKHSTKKVLAALVLVCPLLRCGEGVAVHSRISLMKTLLRRLIVRCTVPVWRLFCPSWCVMSACL